MGRPRTTEEQKKVLARIRSARYYATHPDKVKLANKKWRDKNRDRVNRKSSEYAKSHREQYRLYCISRRTRKTKAGGSFTLKEWFSLCAMYKYRCLCCHKKKKLTADHVIPVSKGGSSNIENIQPLCGPCNYRKGISTTDYRRLHGQ